MRKKKQKKNKKKKSVFLQKNRLEKMIFWSGGCVVFLVLILFLNQYFFVNNYFDFIYKKIPFPVVFVENEGHFEIISSRELSEDFLAVKKFYENIDIKNSGKRIDFSTKDGRQRLEIIKKDVLNKLVEDAVMEEIAEKRDVVIRQEEVEKAIESSLSEADGNYKQLILNLKKSYGWDLNDFKKKVVEKQLRMKKVFDWYRNQLANSSFYRNIQGEVAEVKNGLREFDSLVDILKSKGDAQVEEVDWLTEQQIIPEVLDVLKREKNEKGIAGPIISPLGIHILKMEGRQIGENGLKKYKFKQIFIRKDNFVEWVDEQKKNSKILIFSKRYDWSKDRGIIIFREESMREMEKKIKLKSQGDPSVW